MLHTDFLASSLDHIQQWSDFGTLVAEWDTIDHWVGGGIFFPEHIARLGTLVCGESMPPIQPVPLPFPTSARLYALPTLLVQTIVEHSIEALLDISVPWSEVPEWNTINRFDLGGFLVEFQGLCEEATEKQLDVYLVIASDEEWKDETGTNAAI